jgi:hypothetical protein
VRRVGLVIVEPRWWFVIGMLSVRVWGLLLYIYLIIGLICYLRRGFGAIILL